ncbi:MAG: hypothetical protein JWN69_1634 [Alphaproteobacteria bacterium]|nr:hypothetical protein [Alphaproteobacteria bacterium]
MRRFTAKLLIVLVTAVVSTAAFGQSRDQQVAYCMGSDPAQLSLKIRGCTALITSGQESNENLAVEFNNRGNAYDDQNDYARAIADYNEAIRYNPQYTSAFFNRGLSLEREGDHARAIADFNEAIRLNPQYAKAYYGRGMAERLLGNTAQGDADIAHACALDSRQC